MIKRYIRRSDDQQSGKSTHLHGSEMWCVIRHEDVMSAADYWNDSLQVIDGEGEHIKTIKLKIDPWYISSNMHCVWIHSKRDKQLHKLQFDTDYNVIHVEKQEPQ